MPFFPKRKGLVSKAIEKQLYTFYLYICAELDYKKTQDEFLEDYLKFIKKLECK